MTAREGWDGRTKGWEEREKERDDNQSDGKRPITFADALVTMKNNRERR